MCWFKEVLLKMLILLLFLRDLHSSCLSYIKSSGLGCGVCRMGNEISEFRDVFIHLGTEGNGSVLMHFLVFFRSE